MYMKMFSALMLTTGFVVSSHSYALSSNTIEFVGEVADQTCEVSVNGNNANSTVVLPTVSKADLSTSGDTAGETTFTIKLTGCTADSTSELPIQTRFIANNLTSNNRAGNIGDATNVSLEIFDPLNAATAVDLTGSTPVSGLVLAQDATEASYDFGVRYYAEGQATAGSVNGSVQYAISYR